MWEKKIVIFAGSKVMIGHEDDNKPLYKNQITWMSQEVRING